MLSIQGVWLSILRVVSLARPRIREGGGAPKRGRHSTIVFSTKCVQWQLDGFTMHTNKCFLGAGFLGAPSVSLIEHQERSRADPCHFRFRHLVVADSGACLTGTAFSFLHELTRFALLN